MSDLTEFLLARLADDELEAGNCHVLGCMLFTSFDEGWCDCTAPARVLAEVAAKRRIVERWQAMSEESSDPCESGWAQGLGEAVRLLALPYASHAAYRQEWGP